MASKYAKLITVVEVGNRRYKTAKEAARAYAGHAWSHAADVFTAKLGYAWYHSDRYADLAVAIEKAAYRRSLPIFLKLLGK